MKKEKKKTKEYQKRAIDNYRSRFDLYQLRLKKGYKEAIVEEYEMNISELFEQLLNKDFYEKTGKNIAEVAEKRLLNL